MKNVHDHISSVQSRIDELEHTISQRGEQIKNRAKNVKDELREELSPKEIISNYPVPAAGASFIGGLLIGRMIKGLKGTNHKSSGKKGKEKTDSSALKAALGTVAVQALYMGRDYAISWLKDYTNRKKEAIKEKPAVSQR